MIVKKLSVIEEALMEFEAGVAFYYRTTTNYNELQSYKAKLKEDPKNKTYKYKVTFNTKMVINDCARAIDVMIKALTKLYVKWYDSDVQVTGHNLGFYCSKLDSEGAANYWGLKELRSELRYIDGHLADKIHRGIVNAVYNNDFNDEYSDEFLEDMFTRILPAFVDFGNRHGFESVADFKNQIRVEFEEKHRDNPKLKLEYMK